MPTRQACIQSKCMTKLPAKFVDGVAGETARKKLSVRRATITTNTPSLHQFVIVGTELLLAFGLRLVKEPRAVLESFLQNRHILCRLFAAAFFRALNFGSRGGSHKRPLHQTNASAAEPAVHRR